ncbi:MAG: hypothetical protein IT425_11990 [Pirellulales bacterium]|nr:hypothetical protein [Pirellulales bacterium]
MQIRSVVLGLLLCIHSLSGVSIATAAEPKDSIARRLIPLPEMSGPSCGVGALYSCLKTLGIDVEWEKLWLPEYIGGKEGSSVSELIKGAQNNNAYASVFEGLVVSDLVGASNPMILHVRSKGSASKFNHWIAYLGVTGDQIKLFDITHGIRLISKAELMAIWDGYAIEISSNPIAICLREDWFLNLLLFTTIGNCTLVYKVIFSPGYGCPQLATVWSTCRESFLVVLLTILVTILFHVYSEVGFMRNPTAVSLLQRSFFPVSEFEQVNIDYVREVVKSHEAVIIDARFTSSFINGAIPGALSIPTNSSLSFREKALADVDPNKEVIVYCQSSTCHFANDIAAFLKLNGFTFVKIYSGGYADWSSSLNPTKRISNAQSQ